MQPQRPQWLKELGWRRSFIHDKLPLTTQQWTELMDYLHHTEAEVFCHKHSGGQVTGVDKQGFVIYRVIDRYSQGGGI